MEVNKIINGDCIQHMKQLPENSIDAIVTDPPYGLEFMGKEWDKGVPSKLFWKEMLRVLKHGGFLLSFSGTRTYHKIATNIENAGFEIRDTIMWLYGSGFPKSLNIGKQIDKMADKDIEVIKAKQELGKWLKEKRGAKPQKEISKHFLSKTGGLTGCVANWELGLNLPTWEIWIKLKEILELDERFDYLIKGRPKDYIPAEREVVGKDGRTAKDSMFGIGVQPEWDLTKPATPEAKEWEGWGTALKPAVEPIVVARKPLSEKNVALNVLKWGTGGINIDGCRVEGKPRMTHSDGNYDTAHNKIYGKRNGGKLDEPQGRFPANIILDEEAGKMLGEPSRFFYCAKASKSERNLGCDELEAKEQKITNQYEMPREDGSIREIPAPRKNNHPTVKPIKLMEYLVKLVSRKGAVILDPFLGSGTTAIACIKQGRKFIGIEKEEDYVKIAKARIKPFLEQQKLEAPNTHL